MLPGKEQVQKHFPTDQFSKELIFNSLLFAPQSKHLTSRRKANPTEQSQSSLELTIESIHTDLLKHPLQITNETALNPKMAS